MRAAGWAKLKLFCLFTAPSSFRFAEGEKGASHASANPPRRLSLQRFGQSGCPQDAEECEIPQRQYCPLPLLLPLS